MTWPTESVPLLLFASGLLGGAGHCVGMCGPLVAGYALALPDRRATLPHLLYNLGRVTTYAVAGGLVGLSGSFLRVVEALAPIQHAMMFAPGLLIVIMGLIDGIFAYLDFQFAFQVTMLDPGFKINGASLDLTSALRTNGGNNGSFIREEVGTGLGMSDLGVMSVEFSWLDPDLDTLKTSDAIAFGAQGGVWVTKNILVWAEGESETAGLFGFTQRFAQTTTSVPEPAPIALIALALAGLFFMRRRPV